ncbi:MAG: hypothetical protein ACXAC7_22480, partial [Candidatus Hodarchaeales archaeon]
VFLLDQGYEFNQKINELERLIQDTFSKNNSINKPNQPNTISTTKTSRISSTTSQKYKTENESKNIIIIGDFMLIPIGFITGGTIAIILKRQRR